MKTKTTYITEDGKEFSSKLGAEQHERKLKGRSHEFLKSYTGQSLLKKHSLDEFGTWQIFGEDPNCDMGGYHHQPRLEVVTGTLKDVIEYGVKLPKFFTWGAGGDFVKLDIKTL